MIGIYIRVSSATQVKDGYSLTAQKERLTAFCKAQGWDEYKFYVEEGLSAKNTKRPVYQELMQHVKNKKVTTVLVYKLDRIMRSIGELDNMLKIFDKNDCAFKSATEPFDTSNATGKLFIYLVGALAQWEIELSSERIKMVLEEKVANEGIWIGNVPFPFDKNDETKKLVANENRASVTLKMIDLLKKGYSSVRIADYLNIHNTDKETWHFNAVLRILRNPALYGATRWNEDVYEGTHEGIISKEEFEQLQTILSDRSRTHLRNVKSTYIFQGKMICPSCSKPMAVRRYFNKRLDGTTNQGATHSCLKCAKNKAYNHSPSEVSIVESLYDYMKNVKLDDMKKIEVEDDTQEVLKEFESIQNKRNKYQRAWANDLMTDEEFQKMMEETREPYENLKEQVDAIAPQKPIDIKAIKDVILTFNKNFNELSTDEQRDFVSMFIRKIHFKVVPQKPKDPKKAKVGRPKVKITDVEFY